MDDSKHKTMTQMLKYLKSHPFPMKCLSDRQIEAVVKLQSSVSSEEHNQQIERKVKTIYENANSVKNLPYEYVAYYFSVEEKKPIVLIVFSDDDFNILYPYTPDYPKKIKALAHYFGLDEYEIRYVFKSAFEENISAFKDETETKDFIYV